MVAGDLSGKADGMAQEYWQPNEQLLSLSFKDIETVGQPGSIKNRNFER
jgi:hypothetical protein